MRFLIKETYSEVPPLGGQQEIDDPIAYVKFFTPDAGWTWYVTECGAEEDDFMFYGYVIGHEPEWGYFRLSELQTLRGKLGLAVERDLYFTPSPMSKYTLD